MSSERSTALAEILALEPPDRLRQLAVLIENGPLAIGSRRPRVALELGGSDASIGRVVRLLSVWSGDDGASPVALVDVLRAAASEQQEPDEDAELVWTGPDAGHPTARRTQPVLNELLEWASRRVTIIGYSLFLAGPAAQDLLGRLGELSTRGVNVEFIVDRRYSGYDGIGGEGHSIREIQKHWPKNRRRPVIRSWASPDNASAKLHAKVVIVDGRDLLVTSANLTGAGLGDNLELGVRLRGKVAADCAQHFDSLNAARFFVIEPWDDE